MKRFVVADPARRHPAGRRFPYNARHERLHHRLLQTTQPGRRQPDRSPPSTSPPFSPWPLRERAAGQPKRFRPSCTSVTTPPTMPPSGPCSPTSTKAGNTGGNELHTANGLWVQKGFAIQPAFENTLANNYHAPLTPLDFAANPEAARAQINRLDRRAHQREDQGPVPGRLTRRPDPPCPHRRHLLLRQVAGPVRHLAHPARALHSADRRHHAGQLHEPDLAFRLHGNAVFTDSRNALRRHWNRLRRSAAEDPQRPCRTWRNRSRLKT